MAVLYHPVTKAEAHCPDEAVQHYRSAGWITLQEHREAEAARLQREADAQAASAAADSGTSGRAARAAGSKEQ